MNRLIACLTAVAALALTHAVHAERADSEKPVNVESDRLTADDAKKVSVFEGRVVVTQGTRILRADRVTIRQDADGFTLAVAEGKPATFREKREGTADEWIDGEAERIEYDGRKEFVELFNKARLNRDKDEVRGNYISYDQKADFVQVQNAKEFVPAPGREGRVRAVLQPRPKGDAAQAPKGPPVELRPTETPGPAR
ncbi:MAG: lipopolysaccharide transport periplasmic protein LptA [Burkholderiales bacterium]|jgi:lipopolysaccharide export system protein LptA|nr:lipopolysaccharide transport periplasmic protein LptA [Burkholderiales bacterium]